MTRERRKEKLNREERRMKREQSKERRNTRGPNKTQKAPVVAELSSDSEVEDEDQYGVQDKEISSNECAICFWVIPG